MTRRARPGSGPSLVLALLATAVAGCFPAAHVPGPGLAHFPETAPGPGQPAPEFALETVFGEQVRSSDLIGERPVVLQVGSRSCPVFRYRRFGMAELYDDYRERVTFVVVYSREAHPVGSKSPYAEGEWDLLINRLTRVRLDDPTTYEERKEQARASRDELGIEAPVLVDDMDDQVWRLFGAAPSPAYVIDRRGRVVLRQAWVDPEEIRETLEELLAPATTHARPPDAGFAHEAPRRRWFPEGSLYAPYLAEISRPGFGLTVIDVPDNGIADAGDLRFGLKLGGRFGLLRLDPPRGRDGRVWQLDLGAGFYGQFDIENSLDNIGWDGLYGLALTSAPSSPRGLGLRLGVRHWSSHVGDEYAERTGRRRIGYTREEVMVGLAWPGLPPDRGWRAYLEGGYGYSGNAEDVAGAKLQQPGRAQVGIEYEAPGALGNGGRWGWYAAFDATAYEERDWEPDLAFGTGVLVDARDRRWRAGITLYDGRTPIGEFFRSDERYAVVGLWLDLERRSSSLR